MIAKVEKRKINADLPVISLLLSPAEIRHIKAELEKVATLISGKYQDIKDLRGEMGDYEYRALMAERMRNFTARICAPVELFDEDIDAGLFGAIITETSDEIYPSADIAG